MMKLKENFEVYAISGNRESGMAKKFYELTKDHYINGRIDIVEAEKLTGWNLNTSMGAPLVDFCNLTQDEMEYLVSLPETLCLENNRQTFILKHIMPLDDNEKELLEAKEKEVTTYGDKRQVIVLSAHTHEPNYGIFNNTTLFNPGSCGLTDNGNKGAYYGILNHGKLLHLKTNYDYQKLINNLKKVTLLYDKCENWGFLLEFSIKYGVNAAALYVYEKNRIKTILNGLSNESIKKLESFNDNQVLEFIRSVVPILSRNEKPFATCLSTNFNPFGGYINRTVFVSQLEDNSLKQKEETIENHVVSNNSTLVIKKTDFKENIIDIINKIAYEYTKSYCINYANEVEIIEERKKN